MAIDPKKSFEVSKDGITIDSDSGIWIGGGSALPTFNAPEGSRYFRTSPEEAYKQVGPGDNNNWELVPEVEGDGVGGVKVAFINDGSSYNKWLRVQDHHLKESGPHSDDQSMPWVFPFDGNINGYIFVNKKENVGTDIEIYKNGTLASTFEIRNRKWETATDVTPVTFSAGDKLSIFLRKHDPSVKPEDVLLHILISFTDGTAQELGGSTL